MASILPAQELRKLIDESDLVTGWPDGVDITERVQSASVDLSAGSIITPDGDVVREGRHSLPPGGMAMILTHEDLNLPDDIAGTVFAPNALSVRGLLVLNPGHIDPGTKSPITARIINFRRHEAIILVGEPILTVVFERLSEATDSPYSTSRPRSKYERELVHSAPETMSGTIDEFFRENIVAGLKREFLSRSEARIAFGSYLWALLVIVVGVDKIRQLVSQAGTLPEPWVSYREVLIWIFLGGTVLWAVVRGLLWGIESGASWVGRVRRRWRTE